MKKIASDLSAFERLAFEKSKQGQPSGGSWYLRVDPPKQG